MDSFLLNDSNQSNCVYITQAEFSNTVVIDLGGTLSCCSHECLAYRDLSVTGNMSEAARELFDTLRWAETLEGAALVLLPYVANEFIEALLKASVDASSDDARGATDAAMAPGLADRMFRAASGRYVDLCIDIEAVKANA